MHQIPLLFKTYICSWHKQKLTACIKYTSLMNCKIGYQYITYLLHFVLKVLGSKICFCNVNFCVFIICSIQKTNLCARANFSRSFSYLSCISIGLAFVELVNVYGLFSPLGWWLGLSLLCKVETEWLLKWGTSSSCFIEFGVRGIAALPKNRNTR